MKIVIVGAGIGGCSSYLFLRHYIDTQKHSIQIFESHSNPLATCTRLGGGLAVGSNGLRALSLLGSHIPERIVAGGSICEYVEVRSGRNDTFLGLAPMGSKARYGWSSLMCERAMIHECLLEEVAKDAGDGDVRFGAKLVRIAPVGRDINLAERGNVEITLAGGTFEYADLVIGADGVWSGIRDSVTGDRVEPQYIGLSSVSGMIPLSLISPYLRGAKSDTVVNWGPNGFFGYSACTSHHVTPDPHVSSGDNRVSTGDQNDGKAMWWSTHASPEPLSRDLSLKTVGADLSTRFAHWKGAVPDIIRATTEHTADHFFVLPTYVVPEIKAWHRVFQDGESGIRGGVTVLGDAAHAMPTDGGQGVSSAIEDAAVLALLLQHYLKHGSGNASSSTDARQNEMQALSAALEDYTAIRKPRVAEIKAISRQRSDNKRDLSPWKMYILEWVVWAICKFMPEGWGGNDKKFGYKVEEDVERYLQAKKA